MPFFQGLLHTHILFTKEQTNAPLKLAAVTSYTIAAMMEMNM